MEKKIFKSAVCLLLLCGAAGNAGVVSASYNDNVIVKPTYTSGSRTGTTVTNEDTDTTYSNVYGDNNTVMGLYNHVGETIIKDSATYEYYSTDKNTVIGFKNYLVPHNTAGESQVIGNQNMVGASGSTVIGANNKVAYDGGTLTTSSGYKYSVVLGTSNTVNGGNFGYGIAVGYKTTVSADYGTAVGYLSQANATSSMALGFQAYTDATDDARTYDSATKTFISTVSFGSKGQITRGNNYLSRLRNVADGIETTDVATYGQLLASGEYNAEAGTITFKNQAGKDAFTVSGITAGGGGGDYSGSETIDITDGVISAKINGAIEENNKGLVNGGTIWQYIQDHAGSSAELGDVTKLSAAGLGENVTDSILSVNDKIENISDDINRVGAGAAALAALRPEGFNPEDKWSFAVGYGHYKNANAGALGAFFKPNADTTLSLGATVGNGDSMMNAGVSFKLGTRGNNIPANVSNAALVREVNELRERNRRNEEKNARYEEKIDEQGQKIKALEAQMQKLLQIVEKA